MVKVFPFIFLFPEMSSFLRFLKLFKYSGNSSSISQFEKLSDSRFLRFSKPFGNLVTSVLLTSRFLSFVSLPIPEGILVIGIL